MSLKIKKLPLSAYRKRGILFIVLAVLVCGMIFSATQQARAARFQNRGMYINTSEASANTHYIISLEYPSVSSVGSLKLEFCTSPIPSLPCDAPSGLDVSGGSLSAQSGETGFSITQQTANLIVLSRAPSTATGLSSYRFDNMVNPDGTPAGYPAIGLDNTDFYVRMTDYSSIDASGSFIDYGSVASTITPGVGLFTQVPPILIFCAAGTINDDLCADMEGDFVNYGELESDQTYYTKSEFLARTNAQYGYTVTANGKTFTSGIKAIPALTTPTNSFVGVGQFGINLAVNTDPAIGASPVGPGVGATPNPSYNTANNFLFNDGDILVTSNGSVRARKFTVSYILNVPEDQAPGVYSTTITYICLAGF